MNLRTKLLSMIVPFVIVIVTTIIFVERIGKDIVAEQAEQSNLHAKHVLFNKIIDSRIEAMSGGLFSISRNKDSIQAILAGDEKQLSSAILPTYNRLSAGKVITKLEIADARGKILYCSDGDTGMISSMPLVHEALAEGKIKRGIQRDDEGNMYAVYAFPLYVTTGKPIGVGVFQTDLNTVIREFKASDGADAFIVNQQGKLDYATDKALWEEIQTDFSAIDDMQMRFHSAGDIVYNIGKVAIPMTSSKDAVYLLTVEDATTLYTTLRNSDLMAIAVSVLMILAMIVGVYTFLKRTLSPLRHVCEVLSKIAQGDLTNDLRLDGRKDEVGELLAALSDMQRKLSVIIKQTTDTAGALDSSSNFISELSVKTTDAVGRQQSESDQVVAAMNQMTSTVMEVARNANSAASSAREADTEASKGQAVVNESIASIESLAHEVELGAQAINELAKESTNIGSVLDVIRDIADQTNLLALNAAIEAARAGEQGRGFAVVADEVRTLASRTAESTAEIQQMIERLQGGARNAVSVMESGRNQAQHSVIQAAEAGKALELIAAMVSTITDMNTQIASAAEEQTAVTDEINRNVVNINDATSSISEGATEVADVGEHLVALSQGLNALVSQFKIK
ncbi:MAG: methyl-accepting chemotaxis protein [Gammaproteobacteria bacterium]|nr:methyl-accepting chemotaxis protein [Gammaproteobacteria bacterium]